MPRPSSASSSSVSSVGSEDTASDVRLATAKHAYTPNDSQVDHLAVRASLFRLLPTPPAFDPYG
jgi:hypothetical protein